MGEEDFESWMSLFRICRLTNLHGSSPLTELLNIHFQISMSKPKPSP